MRKVLLSLLVLALAAPSFAAVNITAEDAGSGVLKLYYECTAGEVIRGLALAVEVTDGDGVVAAASDAVVPAASRFNTFIDYAFTVEAGAPGTYTIGAGHPLANKVAAGVATFPATVYSVSMGCLDEFEKVQGGVTGSGELVAITYTLTEKTCVAISADTLRGGIVGDGITEVNIQASQCLAVGDECVKADAPFYADWVKYGKPACWCYAKNCRGDVDGKTEGNVVVGYAHVFNKDLTTFLAAYNVREAPKGAGIESVENGICADFDRGQEGNVVVGYARVFNKDLGILLANYNVREAPKGAGVPDCELGVYYNFFVTPD